MVESGLFGLFVTAIMCDQLQAIFGDETAVEQAKQQGPYRYFNDQFLYLKFVEIYILLTFQTEETSIGLTVRGVRQRPPRFVASTMSITT